MSPWTLAAVAFGGVAALIGLVDVDSAHAARYDQLRAAAVARCRAIDAAEYQTGLLFNPDGYRSYYVRSECFQTTAILFRDDALCAEVSRRVSLLFSSWGYSQARCRELVAEGVAADRTTLGEMKQRYVRVGVVLRDVRVERNGNGRDFDVIPSFAGEYGHGHVLTLEVLPPEPGQPAVVLHASGYYVDGRSRLRVFLRQDDVRQRLPGLVLDHPYPMRATLTLDVGDGGPSGYWSDAFIERVFPLRERSQSITRDVRF
jgi:hypothetical protein